MFGTYTSEPYLKTRLIRPQVRTHLVHRGRLLRRLDDALHSPVTLVCAPAGYGKTTLLVDWARSCSVPVAWLTLSQEESDAARFLNYFILALQLLKPELGKTAQAALNMPAPDIMESSFWLLVKDLVDLSETVVLVLDDYHWIDAPEVHRMLETLVEHLPPFFHLVIASRIEPPIGLSRLRARAVLLEIRATELSFRQDEAVDFLNDVMALKLSPGECQHLENQTEGWAAGLQLAALSWRSGEWTNEQAAANAGQHYIFEYLAEEVLRRQSPTMQRFLLHTSILDQLSGALCDALVEPFLDGTGYLPDQGGAACLDYLEHANLFTQALDGEHHWYRYHALFADFLRDRLQQTEPALPPLLHRRAAAWLAEHGIFNAAYKHAMLGNDFDQAANIVEMCAEMLERRGELNTLVRWIDAFPDELVRSRPLICLARSWAAISMLDLRLAQFYLDFAEYACSSQTESVIRGEILAARALVAGMQGQIEDARRYSAQAFDLLPGEQHFLFSLLKFNLGLPLMMTGDFPTAIHEFEEAVYAALLSDSPFIALLILRMLGETYILMGRLVQAEGVFRQALELVEKDFGKQSPVIGVALLGLGEICRQRNDLVQGLKYLEDGIEMTMAWMPAFAMDGFIWLACLKQAAGDSAGAQVVLRRAHQISDFHDRLMLDDWWVQTAIMRLNIVQGYLEEVLHWAHNTGLDVDNLSNLDKVWADHPPYFRQTVLCTLARLFMVLGRREKVPGALEKAQKILAEVLAVSEKLGQHGMLLEGLAIAAQVAQALGQEEEAQEYLHRALDLGAPERPLRVFLDEGKELMDLLVVRRSLDLQAVERAYLEELLAAWHEEQGGVGRAQSVVASHQPMIGLVEALSHRELEVLRWIANGKSNQEIAVGLVLSLNTVKKHVSSIIDKLGAKNRTQAVLMARQSGLLD